MIKIDDKLEEALLKKVREENENSIYSVASPLFQESPSGFRSHFIRFCPGFGLALSWLSVHHKLPQSRLAKSLSVSLYFVETFAVDRNIFFSHYYYKIITPHASCLRL